MLRVPTIFLDLFNAIGQVRRWMFTGPSMVPDSLVDLSGTEENA